MTKFVERKAFLRRQEEVYLLDGLREGQRHCWLIATA